MAEEIRLDFGEGMENRAPEEQLFAVLGLMSAYGYGWRDSPYVRWTIEADEISFGPKEDGVRYVLEYREWLEHCVRILGLMEGYLREEDGTTFLSILARFESWEAVGEFGNALIACALDKGPY